MVRWGLFLFHFLFTTTVRCQEITFKGDTLLFNQQVQFLLKENHIFNKKDSNVSELNFQIASLQNIPLLKFNEVVLSKEHTYFNMEIIPNKKKYAVYKNTSLYSFLLEICRFELIQNNQLIASNVLNFVLTYACELPNFQDNIIQYLPDKGPPVRIPELKLLPNKEIVQQIKISEKGIISLKDSIIGSIILISGCSYSSILETYIIYDNQHKVIARGEYFNDEQQDTLILTMADKRKYYTFHPNNEISFLKTFAALLFQFNYFSNH